MLREARYPRESLRRGSAVISLADQGLVEVDERVHRLVDCVGVAGGEQVEKQSAGDSDPEPGVRARQRPRHPQGDIYRGDRLDPVLDDPVEKPGRVRAALQRLAVELKEQPFAGPQRRIGDVLPPFPQRLARRPRRIRQQRAQPLALALLGGAHDLDPQPILGAEVEDQHPVAGRERAGERPQAQIADPMRRDVVNRGFEQLLPGVLASHPKITVPCGTCTRSEFPPTSQPREAVYDFLDVLANHNDSQTT